MATATPTADVEPATYHYVMTVQFADRRQITFTGTVSLTPGLHTRSGTYEALRTDIAEKHGGVPFTVLCFDLAPDAL